MTEKDGIFRRYLPDEQFYDKKTDRMLTGTDVKEVITPDHCDHCFEVSPGKWLSIPGGTRVKHLTVKDKK